MEIDLPESVLEELQKVWKQEWKKLTLADDFIFSRIMQNTEICKEVLELLLKIKISHIKFPVAQKVIQTLKAPKECGWMSMYKSETARGYSISKFNRSSPRKKPCEHVITKAYLI